MEDSKYHAQNIAIVLKVSLKYQLKDWLKGKAYPNEHVVNNRKVNEPYQLWGKPVLLTKSKQGDVLINGKSPNDFLNQIDSQSAKISNQIKSIYDFCTWEQLFEAYKNKYSPK